MGHIYLVTSIAVYVAYDYMNKCYFFIPLGLMASDELITLRVRVIKGKLTVSLP